jgi:hypothetical protein
MIHLKDSQEITVSKIDAVVTALNESRINTPKAIEKGLQMIHSAIVSKC